MKLIIPDLNNSNVEVLITNYKGNKTLFEFMLDEHDIILTISEMEDIIIAVQKFLKQNKK